jgi:AcrR family transcriptional regulator
MDKITFMATQHTTSIHPVSQIPLIQESAIPTSPTQTSEPLVVLNNDQSPAERIERSDAAANRKRILKVAEKLFAKNGVANINMADIAKAAGVGQGTLYRRFANKSELSLALMDSQMADFQNSVIAQLNQMTQARQPKLQQLEWFLDALVHFNALHMPLLCAAQRDLAALPSGRPAPWIWQQMTVRGLIQSAVAAGEVRASASAELDAPLFADFLLAPLHPENFRLSRHVDGYDLARLSAGLQRVVGLLK